MRYITRDLERKMQFFKMAFEDMNFMSLVKRWRNSERQFDVYEEFYKDLEDKKEHMLRLLPEGLKIKIFNSDGSIKNDILNSELYDETVSYKHKVYAEWNNACKRVVDEEKRLYPKLPKTIKKMVKLYMHDESVVQIYFRSDKELVIELAERKWGKPFLVFKGVEKADIRDTSYPTWWLYEELFNLEDGRYEYNVLFYNGEISIVFNEFEIENQTKKYLADILAEYSLDAINAKINDLIRKSTERDGCPPQEETVCTIRNMMLGSFEQFQEVLGIINNKKHFAGISSLGDMERDIILFGEVAFNLLFDSFSEEHGERKCGLQNLRCYSSSKMDRVIKLIRKIGLDDLYRILLETKSVFRDKDEKNAARNIKRLNNKIKKKFSWHNTHTNELYSSIMNYIKLNQYKF